MKRVVLLSALALMITGCSCNGGEKSKGSIREYQGNSVQFYCDEEKGVEYLIYKGYGGPTPRYNRDGSMSKCRSRNVENDILNVR